MSAAWRSLLVNAFDKRVNLNTEVQSQPLIFVNHGFISADALLIILTV